jgi:hypothetical protein
LKAPPSRFALRRGSALRRAGRAPAFALRATARPGCP